MGFDKLSPNLGTGSKQKPFVLSVSRYQDPQMAMELIAHICSSSQELDFSPEFEPLYQIIDEMDSLQKDEKEGFLWSDELTWNLRWSKNAVCELERSLYGNAYDLKIAVAGGYNAGKSSFLNGLLQKEDLLPNSIEPTSLVNTYVNCSNSIHKVIVRGENLRGELVQLNTDVLDSIRHSNKVTAVANVLNRLIIEVPSPEYLSQTTFIDTPGYDNSTKQSSETGKLDADTARNAFEESDVIFWCANIKDQVTSSDYDFIRNCGGNDKPIVVILTRRLRLATDEEVKRVLSEVYKTCSRHLKNVVDIVAFDKEEPHKIISYKNNSVKTLMTSVRTASKIRSLYQRTSSSCLSLFDYETTQSQKCIDLKEKERKDLVKRLAEARKKVVDDKDYIEDLISGLECALIDSYDQVMYRCDQNSDLFQKVLQQWSDSLDRELGEWEKSVGVFDNPDTARRARDRAVDEYNRIVKSDVSYKYYGRESRQTLVDEVKRCLKMLPETLDSCESLDEALNACTQSIKRERNCLGCLSLYKPEFENALQEAYDQSVMKRKKHLENLQQIVEESPHDVFSAISGNDWKGFLLCFHNGVDVTHCNNEGYTPMTWAVMNGNQRMVRFFVTHLSEIPSRKEYLTMKDKNGYTMMDIAIINRNKRIFEYLSEVSPQFKVTKRRAQELADMNNFLAWIENK